MFVKQRGREAGGVVVTPPSAAGTRRWEDDGR